jgi:hypothetical protein
MLIPIKTNDPVKDQPGMFVAAPSGDYSDVDLLECYHESNPSLSICMLQAQCIKFGNAVYKQNEPLNDFQISAMLQGVNPEDVVNNEELLKKQSVDPERGGKVVGKVGVIKQAEDATIVQEPLTIEEFTDAIDPKKQTPPVITSPSNTQEPYFQTLPPTSDIPTTSTTTSTPIVDTSTTTPIINSDPVVPMSTTTDTITTPPQTTVSEVIENVVESIIESTTTPESPSQ